MALATIATVASLATEFGPAVLRGIGSLFGGKTESVAKDIANLVDHVDTTVNGKAAKTQKVEQLVAQLPPDALVELETIKVELEKEKNRRLELTLNDKQSEHRETQTTIREGDKAEDEYVRRTRPKGARLSLYSCIAYIFLFEGLAAFNKGDGANMEFAGILIAPFLTYMGWRTLDKRGHTTAVKTAFKQGLPAFQMPTQQGAR
ncbi:hypothetical protein O1O06_15580 [Grimontia hollisae]|uniref:hypothetical protein n=1 Tax=Grimontia hollisae TaxID=673 RepID=UPI0018EEDB66|nr:hypothetical protein [Grimontia hollisae]MDF2186164.1 hypothetical protein [Grimontia hollisae]